MEDFLGTRAEVLARVNSSEANGLDAAAVETSRAAYGANELSRPPRESLLKRIWDAATEPMLVMLIVAGLIALAVNIFRGATGGEADYLECLGIFVAISLSVAISVIMEGRSAKAFEALSSMSSDIEVRVVRTAPGASEGTVMLLDSSELVVGDIVHLQTGDKVPADGRLLTSTDLKVDESMLTGESLAAKKNAQTIMCDARTPLAERENMV
jgi:Ca2+-transporting ATPase